MLPVLNLNAEEFKTSEELQAWKAAQTSSIEKYVPADYRGFAQTNVDQEYAVRMEAVTQLSAEEGEVPSTTWDKAFLFVPAGLLAVAGVVAAQRRRSTDKSEPLLENVEA